MDSYQPVSKSQENPDSMLSQTTLVWEDDSILGPESFQDLSQYCQGSPMDPSTMKMEISANGSMNVSQDDELNTPEIECEAYFGDSTPWAVSVNTRPGTFDDLSIAEVAPEQQLNFSVTSPENVSVNLYSPVQEEKIEVNQCNEEDFNIMVEREETVEMLPSDVNYVTSSDVVALEPVHSKELHLSLPSESVKITDLVSTPDVLQQLSNCNNQSFDLINFIEDLGPVEMPSTVDFSEVQITPIVAVPQQEGLNETITKNSSSGLLSTEAYYKQHPSSSAIVSVEDTCDSEPSTSYSIVSQGGDKCSSLRLTIKREPECHSSPARRSSRSKRRTSYADFLKEENEDEEEESTPPKRKRHSTPSCSTDGEAPCARYRELRDRNNEASRKSRQTRKAREEEMKIQAEELERQNRDLKVRCEELERQLDTFRHLFIEIMSSRKSTTGDK